jgi:uncharacterized iron-regulated protein
MHPHRTVHRRDRAQRPAFGRRRLPPAVRLAAVLLAAPAALAGWNPPAQSGYVPERVYDTARGAFVDFEVLLLDLTRGDVVLVGEQHDDRNTHRLELALLEGLRRRRDDVVVSLEMFERDVQAPLDRFASGELTEEDFLASARPWPRYRTDYKPLVDFAIAHEWPVVAANVPRPMASEVSKGGFAMLDGRPDDERRWFAADRLCPTDDEYYRRFVAAMGDHPAGGAPDEAAAEAQARNYYASQCLKDETMAESIARAYEAGTAGGAQPVVVHFSGAFHSDFGLGTAARVRRRLPDRRTIVISMLPVEDIDAITPDDEARRRAEYLVYTTR